MGDVASGIATGLAGIVGAGIGAGMRKREAKRQRKWAERMRNTAYQAATRDMKLAGLNPALMYGSGSAASVPSGGMATHGDIGGEAVGEGIATALSVKKAKQEVETLKSQEQKNDADAATAKEQQEFIRQQTRKEDHLATAAELQLPGLKNKAMAEQQVGLPSAVIDKILPPGGVTGVAGAAAKSSVQVFDSVRKWLGDVQEETDTGKGQSKAHKNRNRRASRSSDRPDLKREGTPRRKGRTR